MNGPLSINQNNIVFLQFAICTPMCLKITLNVNRNISLSIREDTQNAKKDFCYHHYYIRRQGTSLTHLYEGNYFIYGNSNSVILSEILEK